MLDKISKIVEESKDLEEILDKTGELMKEVGTFKTFSIFVDRGFPTFAYAKNNKEILVNISIPWQSIAGKCIKEKKKFLNVSPTSQLYYKKPAELTGLEVKYVTAFPLTFLENTFGCLEVLSEGKLDDTELKILENITNYLVPVIYFGEWYTITRRLVHAIKNKVLIGSLALQTEFSEEERNEMLGEAFSEIKIMSEDLLKLAGIKYELSKKNLNDIVKTSIEKLRNMAKYNKKDIEIKEEIMPLEVICNEQALREEVLFNLIKNTWEAWEDKNVEERIIQFKTYKSNSNAIIEIEDNAGGIPKEIADKLFTVFVSSKGAGRGAGMSIAYQIMKYHNGEISFKTDARGTTFYLSLPLYRSR